MKSYRILLYLGLIFIMTFTSCKDEFFKYDDTKVIEGLPASIIIEFESQENTIVTRAERDSIYENRVDNIYVFIFDSQGNVHERKFCTQGNGLSYTGDSSEKGTLQINTTSLNNAKIVGIANVSVQGVTSTAYSITQEDLDGVRSLQELENMVMTMTDNSVERYAIFMMTGFAKHKDENGNWVTSVTIPGTEDGQATLDCTLQLERTDAKVKFVVATENLYPTYYKDFSFSPRSWVVKRVPSQTYILPQSAGDYNGEDAEYFTSLERPFEVITRDETNPKLDAGGSFVFYMPENRKTPKFSITEIENAGYALREKWEKEDTQGDKIFTNANDNSTYVEITGLLSYYNADGQNTNADVRFIVHLGDPNENGDGSYDVNNYNTNRNTFYTYNIKIRGVNDIKVEVIGENPNEVRPGYEGDVVDTEKRAFIFDSHYDRCLIELNPFSLPAEGEGDIYWSINTPFSRGVHTVTDAEVEENLRDYRWIKFAVNAEYGVPEKQYVKYPGDQNYNDPYPFTGQENDKPSPYYDYFGEGHSARRSDVLGRDYNSAEARLLDINQLMKYLRELKNEGINKEITITVFVDENLYFRHPITGEENVTEEGVRSLWKLTSDKEDRILYLVIQKPQYSEDGNSSVVKAEYSFRQRTIRTIFNVDHPDLQTAWGLESVMETKRLQSGDEYNNQANDTRNGRNNCLRWLRGKKWTEIINVSSEEGYVLKDPYNNAAFACMLRNRDLNGDNIIDDREVRWYLASIDQLTDIFLGEYALDEQSRLYPSNAADRENMVRWHYVSSSYNNGDKKPWVLWAEEGASKGSYSDSNSAMGGLYNYRCVRNLGISLNKPDENPTDLVQVKDENDGFCLIDMSYMNEKARRNSYVTVLPLHNERSDVNRPYTKFRVHKNCYGGDGKTPHLDRWISNEWNDWPWNHYQTFSGYPEEAKGYRVPNQRELLIMSSRMDERYWPTFEDDGRKIKPSYVSQTAFSLKGHQPEYDNNREGFLWSSDSKNFFLQNSKSDEGYVRPVQDVR